MRHLYLAMSVAAGLLVGLGAGYALGGRGAAALVAPPAGTETSDHEPGCGDCRNDGPEGFSLSPARHNFGDMREGEAREFAFSVSRPDGAPLRIGRLYSPCPCVRVSADKRSFAPDEVAEIRVHLHSLTLHGKQTFPVYVETIEPEGVLRADIDFEVERVPAQVMVRPATVHLGTLRGAAEASAKLHNLMKTPLRVTGISTTIEGASAEMSSGSVIAPGAPGDITLILPETLVPGPIRGFIAIDTDSNAHARIMVPVEGAVARR